MELKPTDVVLMAYTAEQIKVLGCADVDIQYGFQRKKLRVYVVQGKRSCLLSHCGELVIKVVSSEFYFHKPITVHIELYLFYRFIHFLLYIGPY